MSRPSAKAIGERGSWFAKVNGERIPCVHQHWIRGTTHLDPNYDENDPKFIELVSAIDRQRKVVLTTDTVVTNPNKKSGIGFERTGYVAVFSVEDVAVTLGELRFELRERICDLK